MKFQDDISNMNTYVRTDKPKPICPPLFQSWGHKELLTKVTVQSRYNLFSTISHFGIEKKILFQVEPVDGSCFVFHFILSSSTSILLEMQTFV